MDFFMRIVIVEDNETLANAIAHQLRDQGHSVNLLHDGQSALEFLRQEDFDIVIMDVNLPKIDGFTILKSLRRSENSVPVLLLTARGDIHDR
jgi:Response regulators consisting of a CheY-like receiver domain and a winged-helix DNA-binding domain